MRVYYNIVATEAELFQKEYMPPTGFDKIIEDFQDDEVEFTKRPGGIFLADLVSKGLVESIVTPGIDKLGIELKQVIGLIHFFNQHNVNVQFSDKAF
ncbi:MAG: hypothetical protein K9J17_18435 [Flavobacteriales bacterium]|nr:hypothetical protein [Flavobacteriales bacterium]